MLLLCVAGAAAFPQGLLPVHPSEGYDVRAQADWYARRTYTDPWRHLQLIGEVTVDDFLFGGVKRWGTGLSGWGRSLAPVYGQRVVANTTEFLLGSMIGDDARYRPSGQENFNGRIWHAATRAFTARTRSGRTGPAYSRIFAVTTAVLISNRWRAQPRTGGDLNLALAFGLTDRIQSNLLHEFAPDLKRFGRKVWRKIQP